MTAAGKTLAKKQQMEEAEAKKRKAEMERREKLIEQKAAEALSMT